VHLDKATHQMSIAQMELPLGTRGTAPTPQRSGEAKPAVDGHGRSGLANSLLMEQIVEGGNLQHALKRVRQNKGSPGVDGRTVDDLADDLRERWPAIREQLLTGRFQPSVVKRVEIPKPDGGMRRLGIPTVVDRFIQQAVLQVLQPAIDPTFSAFSYGFRPGRSAHDAVCQAQRYVQEDRHWVVDVDLAQFFDRVNHDMLMGVLAKRITDPRVLTLIRRYLEAGVMASGVLVERHEGTPQGGPLSPLLANVLLDGVDQE
jgi:RNA-directed DNA polymerase